MRTIIKTVFGSRLYGVNVEGSDFDYKTVFVSSLDEFVRGQTEPPATVTPHGDTKIEEEFFHVQKFGSLLIQAQTVAMDMLFTPEDKWICSSPEWENLIANRDKVISKHIGPFAGYARGQAVKYSLKGERLNTLNEFIKYVALIRRQGDQNRVPSKKEFQFLCDEFKTRAGVRIWEDKRGTTNHITHLIEVCGKSFGDDTAFNLWVGPLEGMLSKYGERAKTAAESDGKDYKAMYHAARITSEAIELLRTGKITFPRPEAPLLLDIRGGKYSTPEIADILDELLRTLNVELEISTLQDKPDREWITDWAAKIQINAIQEQCIPIIKEF
jgi:hypothetical protein